MADRLKPCPFCGCKKIYVSETDFSRDDPLCWVVWCSDCNATINVDPGEQREAAVVKWNRRAGEAEASSPVGDAAKLREVLKTVKRYLDGYTVNVLEMRSQVDAALAAPPRNCDVGTAEEQADRYRNFADRYNPCAYKGYARCAEDCPVHIKLTQKGYGELLCQLEWAQMPYEATNESEKGATDGE